MRWSLETVMELSEAYSGLALVASEHLHRRLRAVILSSRGTSEFFYCGSDICPVSAYVQLESALH